MADESELIAEREKKVAELRAAGRNPYANGFSPTPHHRRDAASASHGVAPPAADPRRRQGCATGAAVRGSLRVAGRIVAYRGFGKAPRS